MAVARQKVELQPIIARHDAELREKTSAANANVACPDTNTTPPSPFSTRPAPRPSACG
jgi:hypothetical protein